MEEGVSRNGKDARQGLSYNKASAAEAAVALLQRAGVNVSLVSGEEMQARLSQQNQQFAISLAALSKASMMIRNWLTNKALHKSFVLSLPAATREKVQAALKQDIDVHHISVDGIRHARHRHGERNTHLQKGSIPLRDKDFELIPYILTCPDRVIRGTTSDFRSSLRFYKNLSTGYVVVVEKGIKNSPRAMGTITMWADLSDVSNARKALDHTSETLIISRSDAAKIRKDAENAIKKELNLRLRFADSSTYGYVSGNHVYLNVERLDPDTPLHEYTHLWDVMVRAKNPALWERGVELLKQIPLWEEVANDPLYKELASEDEIASEVHARLLGKQAGSFLDVIAEGNATSEGVVSELVEWIKRMWQDLKATLGVWSGRELGRLSLDKFNRMTLRDLTNGLDPSKEYSDETIRFCKRTDPAPKRTEIGYKVFYLRDGQLYPPMVANKGGSPTPVDEWLDAEAAEIVGQSKTGRDRVQAYGPGTQKEKGAGSSTLAFRPGWHLGDVPYAVQFNRGAKGEGYPDEGRIPDPRGRMNIDGVTPTTINGRYFPKDLVWAEVEYAADVDYQEEAMSYGINEETGKFSHSLAGLPKVPRDGCYRYRTNSNPATDPWVITGSMKVLRVLGPTEVDQLVQAQGWPVQERQLGSVTDADIKQLNLSLWGQKRYDELCKNRAELEAVRVKQSKVPYSMSGDNTELWGLLAEDDRLVRALEGLYPESSDLQLSMPTREEFMAYMEQNYEREFGVVKSGVRGLSGEAKNTVVLSQKVAEVSNRFDAELERQIAGTLPSGHVYQLGRPSEPLLSAGFPDLPIELSASRLADKSMQRGHTFDLKDVHGLVDALQHPIAVFSYGDWSKSQNVIVELEREGKKFLTGIHFNQIRDGLEVNSVRGLFNKANAEWLNWVTQGKLLWADKGKIQALISKQRTILADVTYLDLDSVAKVVNNFENPMLGGRKSLEEFLRQGDQAVEDGVDGSEGIDEGRDADEEETETIEEVRPRGRGR